MNAASVARNGAPNGAVVLMYHRVVATDRDPHAISVQPHHFGEHLEVLRGLAEVVPVASLHTRADRPRVAITFDDGYADNLDIAHPMLAEAGAPATVFVATDGMQGSGEFWWDELEHMLLDMPPTLDSIEVDLGDRHVVVDVRTSDGRERALRHVQDHVATRPRSEINAVLSQLGAQVGVSREPCTGHRRMTPDEVRALAKSGLVDIGGHTRSHTMLSAQSTAEQWDEIAGSKRTLEGVLERPVTSFAYPFGVMGSNPNATARLVRKAGYALACTTREAPVTRFTSRYRIPRVEALDWDGDEFGRRVSRALALAG